jgi:hypothetical protein
MLVKEYISFERGKDPKEVLGIGPAHLKKEIKDKHRNNVTEYYEENDNDLFIILSSIHFSPMSDDRKDSIIEWFDNTPFEFVGFQEVKMRDLNLKKYKGPLDDTRVIVKFKFK